MELQTDGKGNTTFQPILEWSLAIARDETVGLIIDYGAGGEFTRMHTARIQLGVPPEHARAIGEGLIKVAAEAERRIAAKG